MSDLLKLEALSAPPLTREHCVKRCLALQSTIDSAWAFINFLSSLDFTMRITYLNYLHTQAIAPTSMNASAVEEISPVYTEESKTYTQSLSPKKSKAKPNRAQKSRKKPSPVI